MVRLKSWKSYVRDSLVLRKMDKWVGVRIFSSIMIYEWYLEKDSFLGNYKYVWILRKLVGWRISTLPNLEKAEEYQVNIIET